MRGMKKWISALAALSLALVFSCEQEETVSPGTPPVLTPADVPDYDKIHLGSEFYKKERGWAVSNTFYDPLRPESLWYFGRSRQSEHFILFWDKDYGAASPDEASGPYHLDTKAFLDWCEEIYADYVNALKFIRLDADEKSYLDQYKFQVFLWHQTEWAAYGSGPDDLLIPMAA